MKIGDEVYVHGYIDEIRQDTVIIRNEGGYFGTAPSEVIDQEETLQNLTKPYKSDLISRQAAIDEMGYCQTFLFDTRDKDKKVSLEDVPYALEQLPSAQPFTAEQIQTMQELESAQVEKAYELGKADRPTGHWIENDNGTFSCSNCQSWISEEQHHYARHCLYCGARMESEEE